MILHEMKVANGLHTRFSSGYTVVASKAVSRHRGGVALVWREGNTYEVKETKLFGPNVLTFQLVTGADRYYVVGCYIPPSDRTTLDDVRTAWGHCPSGCRPYSLAISMSTWNPLGMKGARRLLSR